jgi:sortase A
MPLISIPQNRPFLRLLRWCFLAIGVALLGVVAYAVVDAKLFQERESHLFKHAMKPSAEVAAQSVSPVPSTSSESDELRREVQPVSFAPGSAIGRLEVGRIGIDVIIAEGTDGKTLRRGVGHVEGTPLPGQPGNVAIAGHRDTYFRALRNVRQDDAITLTTADGSYLYQVDWMKVVDDDATDVLSESNDSVLTLVTCYPFYFVGPAPKRFIVRAHRIESPK